MTQPDLTPYGGRWVALVGDEISGRQVAGVGHTAAEAERLARRNRPRERFVLRYVEAPGDEPLALPPLMERLRPLLAEQSEPVYLVGGAVRDTLLGRPGGDLDFAVRQKAVRLAFRLGDGLAWPAYVLDRERDTGRVVGPDGLTLDFARFRGRDLLADLRDRDFTINAMALPATAVTAAGIVDPTGGLADLAAQTIRLTHQAAIEDDPVRALRGPRLALQLGFSLAPETAAAIRTAAPHLTEVSPERQRDELVKLLMTAVPDAALRLLDDLALLPIVWPALTDLADLAQSPPHHEPVLDHTISVLRWLVAVEAAVVDGEAADSAPVAQATERLSDFRPALAAHLDRAVDGGVDGRLLLRLGGLFHDVGKAPTRSEHEGRIRFIGHDTVGVKLAGRALRRYRFSNETVGHVRSIVANHMRPLFLAHAGSVSRRAAFRFFRDAGDAGLDIGLLSLADHLATHDGPGDGDEWARLLKVVAALYEHYFERGEEVVRPSLLLNGREVIDLLQIEPGPAVGRALRLLEEAQAAGEVDTPDEARRFVQTIQL